MQLRRIEPESLRLLRNSRGRCFESPASSPRPPAPNAARFLENDAGGETGVQQGPARSYLRVKEELAHPLAGSLDFDLHNLSPAPSRTPLLNRNLPLSPSLGESSRSTRKSWMRNRIRSKRTSRSMRRCHDGTVSRFACEPKCAGTRGSSPVRKRTG